jgi:hypothetical protein
MMVGGYGLAESVIFVPSAAKSRGLGLFFVFSQRKILRIYTFSGGGTRL